MSKVLVAMSGGVDSSVAALLLKRENYDCVGVTMRLCGEDIKDTCLTDSDINDAKAVSDKIGIPYHVYNFTGDFKEQVIDRFVNSYMTGATPNPCVDCNRYMKFAKLFEKGQELGTEYIATGHYARIEYDEKSERYLLKKGLDNSKDQSYVLYSLTQEQLKHTLFPLGGFTKEDIRRIAEENGLVNAEKSESQDICFVPDKDYASFIERYMGKTFPCGKFIDMDGNILGEHKGIVRYTIGQRKGLGLSLPAPVFVCEKCVEDNTVTLTYGEALYSRTLDADDFNFISVERLDTPMRVKARVRYNQKEQPATAYQTGEKTVHVEFDEPQRAITKGQSVVLYDGDTVVGGGAIL